MPKFNIDKNNVNNVYDEKLYCNEKIFCYKHQKCNLQLKNKRNDRNKVIMYVLGLISIDNMKNSKCIKRNSKSNNNSNSKCVKRNELQN